MQVWYVSSLLKETAPVSEQKEMKQPNLVLISLLLQHVV